MHGLNEGHIAPEAYTRAKLKNHHDLIHTATPDNSQTKSNRIPLILPFNLGNLDVMKIIKKHWHLLHYSEKCKELFPEPPLLAHRRSPNLSNLLVRATLPTLNPKPRLTPPPPPHMRPRQLSWLRNYQVQNPNCQPKRKNFQTGTEHLLSDGKRHLRTILQGMP